MAHPFAGGRGGGNLENAVESAGIWTSWDLGLVETTSDQQKKRKKKKKKLNLEIEKKKKKKKKEIKPWNWKKKKNSKEKTAPKIMSIFFFINKRKFYPYWS